MILTPNYVYTINGVTINEKIIPDGLRWQSASKAVEAGFWADALYKENELLNYNDNGYTPGIPVFFTVHNTGDVKGNIDGGEQYTRATYNENMGAARVHFYCDEQGAWQNLKVGLGLTPNDPENEAEISWHSGDGISKKSGNVTSLSIEIIMAGDDSENDKKAYDNGARIIAYCMDKFNIPMENLVTHTYWVNELNKTSNVLPNDHDKQSCSVVNGYKWCPAYIFKSGYYDEAHANWLAFKERVASYRTGGTPYMPITYPESEAASDPIPADASAGQNINVGDLVSIDQNAILKNKGELSETVKNEKWIVREITGDTAILGLSEDGTKELNAIIDKKYLIKEESNPKNVEVETISETIPDPVIHAGDIVTIKENAQYYSGREISSEVRAKRWIVRSVCGNRAIIDKCPDDDSSICSVIDTMFLINERTVTLSTTVISNDEVIHTLSREEIAITETIVEYTSIKVGAIVSIKSSAVFYSGLPIPSWVKAKKWVVCQINGDRILIDKSMDGKSSIASAINRKYLELYNPNA